MWRSRGRFLERPHSKETSALYFTSNENIGKCALTYHTLCILAIKMNLFRICIFKTTRIDSLCCSIRYVQESDCNSISFSVRTESHSVLTSICQAPTLQREQITHTRMSWHSNIPQVWCNTILSLGRSGLLSPPAPIRMTQSSDAPQQQQGEK